MIRGFKIDKGGNPLHTVMRYSADLGIDDEGLDSEGLDSPLELPIEESTVWPENFDEILAEMTAPADVRKNPVFDKSGKYEMVAEKSEAVTKQIKRKAKLDKLLDA